MTAKNISYTTKLKIIFAGTPIFAATQLQALMESPHEIAAVFTQPDMPKGRGRKLTAPPVKLLALENHLPVYQPQTLKDKDIQKTLKDFKADLIIVSAYGMILPKAVLDIPKYGCINVHASLLPRFRGAAPIQYAILKGDSETGVTIMQMAEGLDTGPMLHKKSTPITDKDTTETLTNTLSHLGAEALLKTLSQYPKGPTPIPQDDNLATLAPKIKKEQAKIQWEDKTTTILNAIRAYNPWPVAYTKINDSTIRIWQASASNLTTTHTQDLPPGTILQANPKDGLIVSTQDGAISIEVMQLPGKSKMPAKEILKSQSALFTSGKQFTQ